MSHQDHSEADDVSVRSSSDPGRVADRDDGSAVDVEHEPDRRGRSRDSNDSDASGERSGRAAPDAKDQPREGGRLNRITGETRGLVEDLKEWVDLKIQLLQLDFEDRIRQAANQAALTAVAIVIALLALLFGLIAAGEALGAWFDSRSLGFLALAGILAIIAGFIHVMKPRLVDPGRASDDVEKHESLPENKRPRPALTEGVSGPSSEQDTQTRDDR